MWRRIRLLGRRLRIAEGVAGGCPGKRGEGTNLLKRLFRQFLFGFRLSGTSLCPWYTLAHARKQTGWRPTGASGVVMMGTRSRAIPAARVLALLLTVGGALLMVGAVFADQLNLSGGGTGFGWKQLIAAIAGLVLLLIGAAWLFQPRAEAPNDEPVEPAE